MLGGARAGNWQQLTSLKTIFRIAHSFLCCLVTGQSVECGVDLAVLPKMWLQGAQSGVQWPRFVFILIRYIWRADI